MSDYHEALRWDPNHAGAHVNLGVLLEDAHEDYAGAERKYRVVIRCDTDQTTARDRLDEVILHATESAKKTATGVAGHKQKKGRRVGESTCFRAGA
jgi:hypothetical protein